MIFVVELLFLTMFTTLRLKACVFLMNSGAEVVTVSTARWYVTALTTAGMEAMKTTAQRHQCATSVLARSSVSRRKVGRSAASVLQVTHHLVGVK